MNNDFEKMKEKYGMNSKEKIRQELLTSRQELQEYEQIILNEDYEKKDGIDILFTLEDCLRILKEEGKMQELLQSDEKIKNDFLQYNSKLHGVSHTRRVNFFATLIMVFENVDSKTEKLIRAFVQNHDIGRVNDYEDSEHGANSAKILEENIDRLALLTEEEKEKVKFMIKEHSLSNSQNKQDLDDLFTKKAQQKFNELSEEEKQEKTPDDIKEEFFSKEQEEWKYLLDMCKDADKLDRVRLDPIGIFPSEGLDISRLSLSSSKDLENVAYESLDKILLILDNERELQNIERELEELNRERGIEPEDDDGER